MYSTCTFAPEEDEGQVAAFLQRHPEFTLADALGNVDYTFGSAGEANRTGGLPLDVSKVRRIWPCQGGEGHFMARLVKAGTPRTLPAAGEYTPEELLWLDAAAAAGKKGKGKGGKKGVVREPEIHLEVLQNYVENAHAAGFKVLDVTFSPIKGPEGNIEFLGYLAKQGEEHIPDLADVVRQAHEELDAKA